MTAYVRPSDLAAALTALQRGGLSIVAGGTDHYPARVGGPLTEDVLDIGGLRDLCGISFEHDRWRIGATTTWTELLQADLPPLFAGLKAAAREVGGVQIQNAGTVCGNICNASPAADGVPPLLTLDARVELQSMRSRREVPLGDFIVGPRRTVRADDELVTALLIPHGTDAVGAFRKLGARRYLVISIVMAAGVVELDATRLIRTARIAVGACSPVARRLPLLEAALLGQPIDGAAERVRPAHLEGLAPIDDVRASRDYRRDAALTVVRDLLVDLSAVAA
ncbi:MAG: FAD binding domain-containing protein [Burkholderiales bacterium]|nr:FAD binding domain-containing protein [Burkholderiales bacterium]